MANPVIFESSRNFEYVLIDALHKSRQCKKHVLVEFGGDWCVWCLRMHKVLSSGKLKSFISENFIHIRCPVSENGSFTYPPERGKPNVDSVPHFIVLDENGQIICSQDTPKFEFLWFYKKGALYEFFEKCAKL